MRDLSEMLQEFDGICRRYPKQHVVTLCNRYLGLLNEEEFQVADKYYYWFVMVGDAYRSKDLIY